jgi:twinkle protein
MELERLKKVMADAAESICRELLPSGTREKQEWVTGDIHGADGRSLRVHLEGPKAGWWADFQDDRYKGRHLISLWMAARDCEFVEAVRQAKAHLNIKDTWQRTTTARAPRKSEKKDAPSSAADRSVPLDPKGTLYKYLTEDRGIPSGTLSAYGVRESNDGKYIAFRYCEADGTYVFTKFIDPISVDEKGKRIKKVFVTPKGSPKMLYGMNVVPPEHMGDIAIVEGEIDALTIHASGAYGLSVPFGAKWAGADGRDPNDEWILHDYDWLARFETIYMGMDTDEPGQRATLSIAPRMGLERVKLINWPGETKDANGCWTAEGGKDLVFDAWANAEDMDPARLKKPSFYRQEIWERFYPSNKEEPGDPLPWTLPFRWREGELTVWQGFTKHGKTVGLGYVLVHAAATRQRKSVIASMEIAPPQTLQNMMRQSIGQQKPVDDVEFEKALDWLDEYFLIYDCIGTAVADEMLECFAYAVKKYGVFHCVVDSLMKCDVNEEDNESQKDFMNKLSAFAKKYHVHVHLVAHSKKPDAKHPEERFYPNAYQVRGSAHIVDLADNLVCMYRNKQKEKEALAIQIGYEKRVIELKEELRSAEELLGEPIQKAQERVTRDTLAAQTERDTKLDALRTKNDALFLVQRQRVTGLEPIKRLWFDHKESWHYLEDPYAVAENYVDPEASGYEPGED